MIELYDILKQLNIPIAYHHFNRATTLPFIIYYRSSTKNFIADNKVYEKINVVRIELYTRIKDLQLELQLENILEISDIPYEVISETYIDKEKVYQVIYEINI